MKAWYSKVRDTELKDGSVRATYVVTFETDNADLKREVEKYLQGIMDKTEPNSSEKPNNCTDCEHWTDTEDGCADRHGCRTTTEDLQDWKDRMWAEAIVTEPTTEDCSMVEPQTDCGDFADRLAYERGVKHAWEVAQKVFDSTVTFYEAEDVAKQIDKDINVRSKDEPQTERNSDEDR